MLQTFYECISNRLQTRCEHLVNVSLTPTKQVAKHPAIPHVHHEIGCETLRQFPTSTTKLVANTPSGVGADSSCPYPDITNCTYSHYQIRISPPHYVCVYVYAGAINRPLQLLTACQLRGEHSAKHQRTHREKSTNTYEKPTKHSANTQRSPTKQGANTPSGVGADSSCPYPNITNCTYSHYQIGIFVPHFVCVYVYAGAINRTPTAANGLPITWRTLCKTLNVHLRNASRTLRQAQGPIHRARILTLPKCIFP